MLKQQEFHHQSSDFLQNQIEHEHLSELHFKKSNSIIISQPQVQHFIDFHVPKGQVFKCFKCVNGSVNQAICNQCNGKGMVQENNPFVMLFNDVFNSYFVTVANYEHQKQDVSHNIIHNTVPQTDQFKNKRSNKPPLKNCLKTSQKKKPQTQKNSILQFIKTPLQQIIKQESTLLEQKCQKCNICQYEFDNIKYTCFQCENYNVCQQCYKTKNIRHVHSLKKILSMSSKKTSKNQDNQNNTDININSKIQNDSNFNLNENSNFSRNIFAADDIRKYFQNFNHQNQQVQQSKQHSYSQVQKLQIKSNISYSQDCSFYKKIAQKQNDIHQATQSKSRGQGLLSNKNQGLGLFKLKQIQCFDKQKSSKSNTKKYCDNCQSLIEDCFWICQTCSQNDQNFQVCKQCYDNTVYTHPANHSLGLNFFTFDSMLLDSQSNYVGKMKQKKQNEVKAQQANEKQIQKQKILDSILNISSSKISCNSQPQNSNIGVILHRNIFPGFHQEDDCQRQIISPIPRTVYNIRRFKDNKKQEKVQSVEQSDSIIIPELLMQSTNSPQRINRSPERQKNPNSSFYNKEQFNDQSRVLFDDNILMDSSTDYNQLLNYPSRSKSHKRSPRKSANIGQNKSRFRDSLSYFNKSYGDINPQKATISIKQIKQIKNQPNQNNLKVQNKHNTSISISPSNCQQKQKQYVFVNYCCDICEIQPIKNVKYHCLECQNFDLCQNCYQTQRKYHSHENFRKDDGKLNRLKLQIDKQKIIKRAFQQMNSPTTPMKKSYKLIK